MTLLAKPPRSKPVRLRNEVVLLVVNGSQVPDGAADSSSLSPTEASEWLANWFPDLEPRPPRHRGGLRLTVSTRDTTSALTEAESHVARIEARIAGDEISNRVPPRVLRAGPGGSRGKEPSTTACPRSRCPQERHDLPPRPAGGLGLAMELLEPLRQGNPPAAVIGAWAALEALFSAQVTVAAAKGGWSSQAEWRA